MSETPRFDGLLAETEELAFPYRKQQLRRDDVMYNSEFKQLPQNVVDGVVRPFLRYVRPSCGRLLLLLIGSCAFCHKALTYMVFYPLFRLVFGTLYPAYASYKAVKSKNVREYVKWMMYWIVFAFFTCVETITDVFLSWFPFYYEIKIILVIWLLSPATKGSSFLYRKFVHPMLSNREQEIDEYITKAKEQSYKQVLDLGSKGVNALMQTALKNLNPITGTLVQSMSDSSINKAPDRVDGVKRSQSAQFNAGEPYSDDDELIEYEVEAPNEPIVQPAPLKRGGKAAAAKPKGRAGVRKTTRKTAKTELNEFSD